MIDEDFQKCCSLLSLQCQVETETQNYDPYNLILDYIETNNNSNCDKDFLKKVIQSIIVFLKKNLTIITNPSPSSQNDSLYLKKSLYLISQSLRVLCEITMGKGNKLNNFLEKSLVLQIIQISYQLNSQYFQHDYIFDFNQYHKSLILSYPPLEKVLSTDLGLLHFQILSHIGNIDPVTLLPCWSMFLSESYKTEKMIGQYSNAILDFNNAKTDIESSSFSKITLHSYLLKVCFQSNIKELRKEALSALINMISHSPFSKWIDFQDSKSSNKSKSHQGEKVCNTLIKLLELSLISLKDSHDEALSETLQFIVKLFTILPSRSVFLESTDSVVNRLYYYLSQILEYILFLLSQEFKMLTLIGNYGPAKTPFSDKIVLLVTWTTRMLKSDNHRLLKLASIQRYCKNDQIQFIQMIYSQLKISLQPKSIQSDVFISLQDVLFRSYLDLYVADEKFLNFLIKSFESSQLSQERGLCCTLIKGLLEFHDSSGKGLISPVSKLSMVLEDDSLQGLFITLLKLSSDEDHIVRVKALEAMGEYPFQAKQTFSNKSISDNILKYVFPRLEDHIGTVRAAAFRAIGEGLAKGFYKELEFSDQTALLTKICKGCYDTKLAVRIQSTWSLSNYLLFIQIPGKIHSDNFDSLIEEYSEWTQFLSIFTKALLDSDKLAPTAIRGLSYLIVLGSRFSHKNINPVIFQTSLEQILAIYTNLKQKFFLQYQLDFTYQSIKDRFSQKIISSISLTLGFIVLALLRRLSEIPEECVEVILTIIRFFISSLRYGFLQLQVISSQILLQMLLIDQYKTIFSFVFEIEMKKFLEVVFLVIERLEFQYQKLENVNNLSATDWKKDSISSTRFRSIRNNVMRILQLFVMSINSWKDIYNNDESCLSLARVWEDNVCKLVSQYSVSFLNLMESEVARKQLFYDYSGDTATLFSSYMKAVLKTDSSQHSSDSIAIFISKNLIQYSQELTENSVFKGEVFEELFNPIILLRLQNLIHIYESPKKSNQCPSPYQVFDGFRPILFPSYSLSNKSPEHYPSTDSKPIVDDDIDEI